MYLTRYSQPEAVGYLVAEYVRCGKPGCRCQRGQRHGPYWYLRFRRLENGVWRQRKRFIPAAQVKAVRERLKRNKARDKAAMALLRQSRRLRAAVIARGRGKIDDDGLKEVCDGIAGRPVNL